jgi:hypothetical protein
LHDAWRGPFDALPLPLVLVLCIAKCQVGHGSRRAEWLSAPARQVRPVPDQEELGLACVLTDAARRNRRVGW